MTARDYIEILVLTDKAAPEYATDEAAGADIRADLKQPLIIEPRETALIPTGLRFEIPPGFEVQIRPRSGLALNYQITVLNTPGTIDSDFRGEIKVILINHGSQPFVVEPGMRIAQAVVAPVVRAHYIPVSALTESARGTNGFGSSGEN